MKYIDEFRDKSLAEKLANKIKSLSPVNKINPSTLRIDTESGVFFPRPKGRDLNAAECINFMEVCGTHTQSFCRFGINKLLPANINLIAGPGCPVCVSSTEYIDNAIGLARKGLTLLTFGDMMRIPGTKSSLETEKTKGSDIRVVYSAYDSLKIARENPDKKVVFLAVGFETTAPTIGLSLIAAKKEKLNNIYFFCALKLIPPAMEHLLKDKRLNLSGFLCPGHVSAIIGTKPYDFIAKKYKIPCVVAGFEPLDILEGIYFLLRQLKENNPKVINQYARIVKKEGNIKAKEIINEVFEASGAVWRGLGNIPKSGLKIRRGFKDFDAEKVFGIKLTDYSLQLTTQSKCRCADILKGIISPPECPLFAKACSPYNPIGPCMVSQEGACNAYYRYK